MSEYLARLEAGIQKANADGNMEQVKVLGQAYREEQAKSGEQDSPRANGMADGRFDEFAIGMGKGMTDVGRGVKDLWLRSTDYSGSNKDALDQLNARAEEEQSNYDRDLGDSNYAFAGEMVGEIAATAPVGSVLGGITKGAQAIRGGQAMRLAATEGALAEGITQRGGLEERGGAALGGAAGGLVGDAAMKGVGKLITRSVRKKDALGVGRRLSRMDDEADALQKQAMDDGGYSLDRVDATKTSEGYMSREAVRGQPEYIDYKAKQQSDITAKAESFIPESSRGVSGADARESTANNLVGALDNSKNYSAAEVDAFYTEWRMSMGDEKVPLPGLEEQLTTFLKPKADGGSILKVDSAIGEEIRGVLGSYGMLGAPEAAIRDAAGNPIATGGFTVGQIEMVRQELNGYYTPNLSRTAKAALEQAKGIVDEHVALHAFKGLKDESVGTLYKGQKATEAYKIHQKTWGNKTFLGKLTAAGVDGDDFATAPAATLRKLLNSDNVTKLAKVKSIMELGTADEKAAWQSLTELPLIEALEAGLKANPNELGIKAFEKALPKTSSARKLLWGDKADEIDKAIRAWKLNGTKPAQGAGAMNNSNTAMAHNAVSVGARVGAASGAFGRVGQLMLAIPGTINLIKGGIKKTGLHLDAEAIASGKLPAAAENKIRAQLKKDIAAAYGDSKLAQFDNVINFLIRNSVRELATEE